MTENNLPETNPQRPLPRKILFGLVIGLSALVILISLLGIIGIWLAQGPVSDAAVGVFSVIEHTASDLKQPLERVDTALGRLEEATSEISNAAAQISQNIEDKGLVMTLLPEAKEQQLIENVQSAQDTLAAIRSSLAAGLELYRAVNRIPFVSLPKPENEQVKKLETAVIEIKTLVEGLRSEIADFRSGVSSRVDRIDQGVTALNSEIDSLRGDLAKLQTRLTALEVFAIRMQQTIPGAILVAALLTSLFLAFVVYTQVEVIRLYGARWRELGQPAVQETLEITNIE